MRLPVGAVVSLPHTNQSSHSSMADPHPTFLSALWEALLLGALLSGGAAAASSAADEIREPLDRRAKLFCIKSDERVRFAAE